MNEFDWEQIQFDMRPKPICEMDDHQSATGFLGKSENLADVLSSDQETVDRYGLTHQQVAAPLSETVRLAFDHLRKTAFRETTETFPRLSWNDNEYEIQYEASLGRQYSPFRDGTYTSMEITLRRTSDDATLTFSGLLPEMISRYGFYEGREVPYRLNPEDIIEFFHLAPDRAQQYRDSKG